MATAVLITAMVVQLMGLSYGSAVDGTFITRTEGLVFAAPLQQKCNVLSEIYTAKPSATGVNFKALRFRYTLKQMEISIKASNILHQISVILLNLSYFYNLCNNFAVGFLKI